LRHRLPIRAGQFDLVRALVDERLGVGETSVRSSLRQGHVLGTAGALAGIAAAEGRAASHVARFAAVAC
jgi:hypothetical protein